MPSGRKIKLKSELKTKSRTTIANATVMKLNLFVRIPTLITESVKKAIWLSTQVRLIMLLPTKNSSHLIL